MGSASGRLSQKGFVIRNTASLSPRFGGSIDPSGRHQGRVEDAPRETRCGRNRQRSGAPEGKEFKRPFFRVGQGYHVAGFFLSLENLKRHKASGPDDFLKLIMVMNLARW